MFLEYKAGFISELDGVCGNEEKMSEMDQVRKAGAGCVRLGPSCACGLYTLAAGESKVLSTRPRRRGARHVRKGLVAGRGGF